jgi:putative intracellular protease/amidase
MELARKGQSVERPADLMKSPVVLDLLGLAGGAALRETDVESAIISVTDRCATSGFTVGPCTWPALLARA